MQFSSQGKGKRVQTVDQGAYGLESLRWQVQYTNL